MFFKSVVLILITLIKITDSARILAVAGVPSKSHQLFYRSIWLELARRGHDIVLLTTDPMNEAPSNIRQIDWHFTYHIRHNKHNLTKKMQDYNFNIFMVMNSFHDVFHEVVDEELKVPEVQELLKNETEHFDLVMVEYFPVAMAAFAAKFQCPFITLFSAEISNFYQQVLGNSLHPVLYPEVLYSPQINLNFRQRVVSTLFYMFNFYLEELHCVDDDLVRKHFGELPPLRKIVRNVSMVFMNSHPVFSVRPTGPGFVRIGGGLHLAEEKELPKDIKEFLDDADQSVIYFSLGTNIRTNYIAEGFLKIIVQVFRELPYKVLWKFDSEIPETPNNVKMFKWLPQQDVLRHKNVKLFITQGGVQSMEESILAGVPLVVIPFVSDQKVNAEKVVNLGLGIEIDKNTMTKHILKRSILAVMNNSSYKERVKHTAKLLLDEPMSGLEKAIWWTEYVIRHNGAKHFWHPNIDLPLYQFLLLDVIAFIIFVAVILSYIVYKLCKVILITLLNWKNSKKEKTC